MEKRLTGWKKLYFSKGVDSYQVRATSQVFQLISFPSFPFPPTLISTLKRCRGISFGVIWVMDLNFIFLFGIMYVLQFNRGLGSEKCGVIQLVTAWQVAMVFCYRERSFLDKSSECKYGSEWGSWCSKESGGGYGVCSWKYIRLGWS